MLIVQPLVKPDPDRFVHFPTPGAQEWWYFDAFSHDQRDALVLVWYVGLPFDPRYGVASIKHLDDPGRHPQPNSLDHCAVGISWYRDGKTVAYALNSFQSHSFHHQEQPFAMEIDGNRIDRVDGGYSLRVLTPDVTGSRRIEATLRFHPVAGSQPWETCFGTEESTHQWMLAAADCKVEGEVIAGAERLSFRGRGYHDHNAGTHEISRAIRRWEWGRCHHGPLTHVYYRAQPHNGSEQTVILRCHDGQPELVEPKVWTHGKSLSPQHLRDALSRPSGNHDRGFVFVPRARSLRGRRTILSPLAGQLRCERGFRKTPSCRFEEFAELLETRNLNRRLFNWMIPYRLKRPSQKLS